MIAAAPTPRIACVLGTVGGGTGTHVAMLARGCAAEGMAVTVFGPASTATFFSGLPFVSAGIGSRPRPVRDARAVLRLRHLLVAAHPGVVHAHGLRAGAFAALALSGRRDTALAVTIHNAPPAGAGRAGAAYWVLERIVARRAGTVACVSSDLVMRMRRAGAAQVCRAVVAAPAAPAPTVAQVAAVKAELRANGRPVVLGAGRLVAQKGFGTLLSAVAGWPGGGFRPVLVIAGEGPLEAALRTQAEAGGIDVRFLGQRDDVPMLLAAADVVVVPSIWEGQPLIVAEALRAGRPLVASRVGGIPELTGEDGALLVPPADAPALTSAVLSVLSDPGLAARLGTAALARAKALPTADAAVAAALALYRRVTGSG